MQYQTSAVPFVLQLVAFGVSFPQAATIMEKLACIMHYLD